MKKLIVFACCLLVSSAARAQDKTLEETVERIVSHAEETTRCIARGTECPEADVLALKAAAVTDMHDVALLAISASAGRTGLAKDTAMALPRRLEELQHQLAGIEMLETVCNLGILVLNSGASIPIFIALFIPFTPAVYIGLLIGLIVMSAGGLIMLSCLFWWL